VQVAALVTTSAEAEAEVEGADDEALVEHASADAEAVAGLRSV
jgi:hypothetical protein